jgi:hypothetical protein
MINVELCALVSHVVFWFNYSIENKDRLPYFKVVWRVLIKLFNSLPANKVKNDAITIVMPTLKRIEDFCRTSSPGLEMLQCLKLILTDITIIVSKTPKAI